MANAWFSENMETWFKLYLSDTFLTKPINLMCKNDILPLSFGRFRIGLYHLKINTKMQRTPNIPYLGNTLLSITYPLATE